MEIGVCFEKAVNTFKRNAAPFVLGSLVIFVSSMLINYVNRYVPGVGLLSILVTAPLSGGLTMMALAARRGQPIDVPNIFDGFNRALPFIVVNLAVMVGLIACGIGVLVTGFLFAFANIFVSLGEDFGPALTRSKDIALANTGDTILLMAVVFGLFLGGALLCGIGLLVAMPVALLVLIEGLEQIQPGSVR